MEQRLGDYEGIFDVILMILRHQSDIRLQGKTCLFLHNLVWNSKKNQSIFGEVEIILEIIRIACIAPKQNQNLMAYQPVDTAYQSVLYALLAIINMTQDNANNQDLFAQYGIIKVLTDLITDQNFQANKTVCFCMTNLVRNNRKNAQMMVQSGAIPLLANLINDNQDDQLSNRAFSTLEVMGDIAAFQILKDILLLCQKVCRKSDISPGVFKNQLINLSMDSSIFKFLSVMQANKQSKILDKGFNRQNYSQQQSIQSISKLQKYLPILNGIVYMNENAKIRLLKHFSYSPPFDNNAQKLNTIDSLVSIMQRVLPFSQAEYALNILNNLVVGSKSYIADNLNVQTTIIALIDYLSALLNHQKFLLQKSIKLFQIPPTQFRFQEEKQKQSVIKYELEFVTQQNDQYQNQMTCYRIVNGKRNGQFQNPSMFLPDDIIDSLREQRAQVYILLVQFFGGMKANLQKVINGGDKNQFVRIVGNDIMLFVDEGQEGDIKDDYGDDGQHGRKKLFYKAIEIFLMVGEHLLSLYQSSGKKGGGGIFGVLGSQNAKLWKDCLIKIESGSTTSKNAIIKARASQILQQIMKNAKK